METRARRHCRRRQAGRVAVATRRLKTQPAGQAGRCADTAVGLRECGRVGEHGVIEEWGVGWCDVPMYLHHLFFLCFFSTALSSRCRTGVSVGVSQRLSVKGIQRLQLLCGRAACVSASDMNRLPRILVRLVAGQLSGARHFGVLGKLIAVRYMYRWKTLQPMDSDTRSMRGCDPVSLPLHPQCIVHVVDLQTSTLVLPLLLKRSAHRVSRKPLLCKSTWCREHCPRNSATAGGRRPLGRLPGTRRGRLALGRDDRWRPRTCHRRWGVRPRTDT